MSAGGYMSILFGNLLKVDKILSFVPQIKIFNTDIDSLMCLFRVALKNKYELSKFKYQNLNIKI